MRQFASQQRSPYRPNGGFVASSQYDAVGAPDFLTSRESPQSTPPESSAPEMDMPYRQSSGSYCGDDGRNEMLPGAVLGTSFQLPHSSPPLVDPPPLPKSTWNTVQEVSRTRSGSMPRIQSAFPNHVVHSFNSSLSHAPRPTLSHAAIIHHLQQQYRHCQHQQLIPFMSVTSMPSQQMQHPLTKSGMESEAGISQDVACNAESRAQAPSRRERTIYTPEQLEAMEEVFGVNRYPDVSMREELASRLGINESKIQVWFKNRRAKLRNLERSRRRE
ncbi:Homeobox protein EgHBX4 [Echinococcus granulosus]|nr:Homeobox protein EgHBX4 [Echinococcus granulosus]EUB57866.1 Homeobox protein EgHBX4 [Echinococcus granulosus]KAH9278832.1 Homeobox protein EgHBX4 [Echinococcus granulosus]KAH9279261.1 Homeobox protein EgHBX4 [Echinococcus granulosus]